MHCLAVVPQSLLREWVGIPFEARNLRKRLSSYRVANPERLPRRIVRLLHRVTRIEFDICPTEETACNREELLICVLNPRFNGTGKVWPRPSSSEWALPQRLVVLLRNVPGCAESICSAACGDYRVPARFLAGSCAC